MKVNYTLPGVLPESQRTPAAEPGERPLESFSAKLRRLRAPEHTSWRSVLRLDATPSGAATIGPPPPPPDIDLRDGVSQRAWWRAMLDKHARNLESVSSSTASGIDATDYIAVGRMLALLLECQRLEDEVFARHLAEGAD